MCQFEGEDLSISDAMVDLLMGAEDVFTEGTLGWAAASRYSETETTRGGSCLLNCAEKKTSSSGFEVRCTSGPADVYFCVVLL